MKSCIRCNQSKPFEAFHKHKGMKDGRLNKCAVCVKECVDEWRIAHPDSRKKEHARNRERKGFRTRKEYFEDRFPNPIGRKASSLKHSYKRRRLAEKMFQDEFDVFVFEEAVKLCALREQATGFKWQVDHIVPMMHKKACGLNTAHNFQVVPALWNQIKGNRNMDTYFQIAGY